MLLIFTVPNLEICPRSVCVGENSVGFGSSPWSQASTGGPGMYPPGVRETPVETWPGHFTYMFIEEWVRI